MTRVSPPLSLRRNFSWTLVGNGVYTACKWVNVLVLVKLATTQVVGAYALGLAICAPVMMLTDLHLRTIQATDARREVRFADYLKLRGLGIILGISVISAIALGLYGASESLPVILGIAVVKGVESLGDVFYGLFQQRERMDRVARSMLLKAVLGTTLFAATFAATLRLLPAILALAVCYLAIFAVYDLTGAIRLLREEDASSTSSASVGTLNRLRDLVWLALPMGIVMMLNSLYVNVPRYVIERFEGASALGIFSALAYIVTLGSLFVGSLGQAVSPRLARYFASGELVAFRSLMARMLWIVLAIGAGGVVVAALLGEVLLAHLYSETYAMESELFVWLVIVTALSFFGSVFGTAVTAMRQFRVQALIQTLNVLLISALSYPLVLRYGLRGAAWAMLLTTSVMIVMYGVLARRSLRSAATVRP